jgi:formylglycine-generating enzyme required for sulfatase activity
MAFPTDLEAAGLQALSEARVATDTLFQVVRPDCLYDRPIPERNRIVFYRGHLEAFDWNLLAKREKGVGAFRADLDDLFAFGIDPGPGRLPSDKPSDWPAYDVVNEYVEHTRSIIDRIWDEVPEQLRWVALEHRLMHAETLAYMLNNLPLPRLVPPTRVEYAPMEAPPIAEMVDIPAGTATLGRRRGTGFGWDNEYDLLGVAVPAFAIAKRKVTNGEYLDFVKTGAAAPHFWVEHSDGWYLRCMFAEIPLPPNWPVYVTHEQARAYATWMGLSLPTEAEWHRAACGTPDGFERAYPWGSAPPAKKHGNFGLHRWDPVPVTEPGGESAFGVAQLSGNGWEWTSTVFEPFPGFEPFPFYPGYSADFFDGAHYVLKGASPRTATVFLRRTFRNWFRPNYPYVYAGFRCVER